MDKYIYIPGSHGNRINCQPLNFIGHEKIAEEKTTKLDPKVVDVVKKITPNPDKYIHILLTALGSGEVWGSNSNADFFFENDLKPEDPSFGHQTFLNAGIFTHHKNKDMSKTLGKVLLSIYNPKMKRVELIERVDRDKAKEHGASDIYDRLNDGEHLDVSMGCRVKYDVCMICGNKAPTRAQYCDEMKQTPGRILPDGRIVCVFNPKPIFFDISFVNVGAAKNAKVMSKLAEREDGRVCLEEICSLPMTKTAHVSVVSNADIGTKHRHGGDTDEDLLLNDIIRDYIIQKRTDANRQGEASLEGLRGALRVGPVYDSDSTSRLLHLDRIKEAVRQVNFNGLTIKIEVEKGETRKKKTWSTKMKCAYGHIPKTSGGDGESIDVYLNDNPNGSRVFIIRQLKEDKTYDEDKIMLGFKTKEEAKEMYLKHIPSKFFGAITETDMKTFLDKYLSGMSKEAMQTILNDVDNCNCGCSGNCVTSKTDEIINQMFSKLSNAKNASQNKQSEIIKKVPALIEPISSSTDKVEILKNQKSKIRNN